MVIVGGVVTVVVVVLISIVIVGGDFGDFGVSFVATVVGRYTRRGDPHFPFRASPYCATQRIHGCDYSHHISPASGSGNGKARV